MVILLIFVIDLHIFQQKVQTTNQYNIDIPIPINPHWFLLGFTQPYIILYGYGSIPMKIPFLVGYSHP